MTTPPSRHVRCKLCGWVCRGLLPVDYMPDGAMLLHHLSWQHPDQVKPYPDRMAAGEDIAETAAEAYEGVEGDETR